MAADWLVIIPDIMLFLQANACQTDRVDDLYAREQRASCSPNACEGEWLQDIMNVGAIAGKSAESAREGYRSGEDEIRW
jgi:hypothetical protein